MESCDYVNYISIKLSEEKRHGYGKNKYTKRIISKCANCSKIHRLLWYHCFVTNTLNSGKKIHLPLKKGETKKHGTENTYVEIMAKCSQICHKT